MEAQLDDTVFYYIDENGELQLAQLPADPERNIFKTIMAVAQITIGAILIVTGAGAVAGAGMIISGTVSLLSDELSQIMSGLGTISTGLNCIMVGLTCFTCPWGAVLGVVDIVVGAATVAVGMNDIATAVTGRNFIRELTGMSEQAYFWTSLGLNVASSALTIASTALRNTGKLCFVAGTGVLVVGANGVLITKNIEDIKVGDRVMTYNEETGYNEVKTVLETYTSEHTELISVTTSDGQAIKSSLGHKYFTNRGWISAENLRAGDILQNVNGEQVIVEQVQHELLEYPETLYNFAVDDNHNYYVLSYQKGQFTDSILVHNDCPFNPKSNAKHAVKYKAPGGKDSIAYQQSDGFYYAKDITMHGNNGQSYFKVLKREGKYLRLIGDADQYGQLITGKHSSYANELFKIIKNIF